jgi:hypothetical protein
VIKKDKDISESQFIRDLKTVCPDISKEDIEWHVNLSRQTVSEKIVMDDRIKELALKAGFKEDSLGPYAPDLEEILQLMVNSGGKK